MKFVNNPCFWTLGICSAETESGKSSEKDGEMEGAASRLFAARTQCNFFAAHI